jgi:hypothetical protein
MNLLKRQHVTVAARPLGGGIAAAAIWLALQGAAITQDCNPVIDGTYCATQMTRPRTTWTPQSAPIMNPIRDLGSAMTVGTDTPGTLGGFSIRSGGTTCIGLLRRGSCS